MLAELEGKDVVELGCGTAYFGAWLKRARRAARRRCRRDAGPARDGGAPERADRPGSRARRGERGGDRPARRVVRPRDLGVRRLDLVRSVQVDPRGRAPPEARRRAGLPAELDARGALLDGRGHERDPAAASARPASASTGRTTARRSSRWATASGCGVLRANGFELIDLAELYADVDATKHAYYNFNPEWARRWPWEEIWRARKTA